MPAKKNPPPAYKEYPEPVFPSNKARAAYRKAQGIIKKAWRRMQAGEEVTNLGDALAAEGLTALPPEIGLLTALTRLDLSYNQLTALPPELRKLTKLWGLILDGNAALGLPLEVLGKTWDEMRADREGAAAPLAIMDYYFASARGGRN